ncbi:MAG: GxxExxY protein [Ignavibacteria bacterium]|nr:GxxExxY protein [Ignavibacteria bacterium]
MTKKYLDELTYNIIGAVIEVHKTLGPGLLESIYHVCLKHELHLRKINFISEMKIPLIFKEVRMSLDLRCDLFIEKCLVLELKAVESFSSIHEAQLLTYMKLLNTPKGILINFNCTNIFKGGQKTLVNELFRELPDG